MHSRLRRLRRLCESNEKYKSAIADRKHMAFSASNIKKKISITKASNDPCTSKSLKEKDYVFVEINRKKRKGERRNFTEMKKITNKNASYACIDDEYNSKRRTF